MPQINQFDGPVKNYCLLNSPANHIHVRLEWGPSKNNYWKYQFNSAWKEVIGQSCPLDKYPFHKSKKFIQFIKNELELDPEPKNKLGPVETQEC